MAVLTYKDPKTGQYMLLSTILAGKDGKSAYQSAVETTGFKGSEAEWVESLACHPDQVVKVGGSMPSTDTEFQLFIDETDDDPENEVTLEELGLDIENSEKFQNVSAEVGLMKQRRTEWKNVKMYGVKGDGVTDDTAAIQALFDNASPGDIIYFPNGRYIISSGLVINQKMITLKGDNPGNWGFTWNNWSAGTTTKVAAVISLKAGVSDVTMLTIKGASTNSNVNIENIKFEGSSYTWTEKSLDSFDDLHAPRDVYDVSVTNENVNGIYCDTDTLKFSQVTLMNVTCSGFSGTACKLGNCGRTVNYACMYSNIALETGIDNVINHAYITMCNSGIKIGANNAMIYNTWLDLIRTYGIFSDNWVSGNFVLNMDHIGYAAFKVKGLLHANMTCRLNRCGGYYFGCKESVITEYDKAAQIWAETARYCVMNITFDADKNWSDSIDGEILKSTPYNFAGNNWFNNSITVGMQAQYGLIKKVSNAEPYKLYNWHDNAFTVGGKHHEMGENGLLDYHINYYLPTHTDTFETMNGKLTYAPLAKTLPTSMKLTFPAAKTYARIHGSDNKWLKDNMDITEVVDGNNKAVLTDYNKLVVSGSFAVNGIIYVYGGATTNEVTDIVLEEDTCFRTHINNFNGYLWLSTSEGEKQITEEILTIPAGVTIYGMYFKATSACTSSTFLINAACKKKMLQANVSLKLADNTNATMVNGSAITYENGKWLLDSKEFNSANTNELNEFFFELLKFEVPVISAYYKNIQPIELTYTTIENERKLNETLDTILN